MEIQEACMHALDDLRLRFTASQRTVGALTRQLLEARLRMQAAAGSSTAEHACCAPAALEAQEALLSRQQTCAFIPEIFLMCITICQSAEESSSTQKDVMYACKQCMKTCMPRHKGTQGDV